MGNTTSGITRQVIDVAAGVSATDAVNVSQLSQVVSALGTGSIVSGQVSGVQFSIPVSGGGTQTFTNVQAALSSLGASVASVQSSALTTSSLSASLNTMSASLTSSLQSYADNAAATAQANAVASATTIAQSAASAAAGSALTAAVTSASTMISNGGYVTSSYVANAVSGGVTVAVSRISTLVPSRMTTTSLGRWAPPPGMFSTRQR